MKNVTAVHEAGHAVVAVHLKVKLNYLTISLSDYGFLNSGCFGFVHTEHPRSQLEDAITVCAAGAEAERHFFKRTLLDSGDRLLIAELAKGARIPRSRVQLLRRRAARLMRTWYMQVAIVNLANELLERDTIPGARVKYIYRKAKSRRTLTVPVAALRPPEGWMFYWTPKTFEKDVIDCVGGDEDSIR